MPKIQAGKITMNYDRQGSGEPLVLIPYLAADYACYAFQVADYSKHFSCVSVDLRGTGETDKPGGVQTTEMFADDVAALMQSIGIQKAHIYGLSLGAAASIWLAAKYPDRVKSLSLHSGWPKSDAYVETVVRGWQVMAKAINSVPEMVIQGIFPWCFTPELYAQKPDYIQALSDFVRGRPKQPVDAFIQQSDAAITHDAEAQLSGYDACFFCAGVSSVGMSEADYTRVTYDTTVHFAEVLARRSPNMVFCYVTGAHTDSTVPAEETPGPTGAKSHAVVEPLAGPIAPAVGVAAFAPPPTSSATSATNTAPTSAPRESLAFMSILLGDVQRERTALYSRPLTLHTCELAEN